MLNLCIAAFLLRVVRYNQTLTPNKITSLQKLAEMVLIATSHVHVRSGSVRVGGCDFELFAFLIL